MPVNLRLNMFERWLRSDDPDFGRRPLVYHRGELARDAERDPGLAALAARVRQVSNGEFDEVSRCGHIRGHTSGSRKIEITTRPGRGERIYLARRLA